MVGAVRTGAVSVPGSPECLLKARRLSMSQHFEHMKVRRSKPDTAMVWSSMTFIKTISPPHAIQRIGLYPCTVGPPH